ncbi:MAG: penicillin-insensitive murein endopeptidase [Myxococcota bacterium]
MRADAARTIACVALAAASCGVLPIEPDAEEATPIDVPAPATLSAMAAIIPYVPHVVVNLDAVQWTAPRAESLKRLADRWGADEDELLALNPCLADEEVDAGEQIVVYRYEPDTVSRSVGAPNRGRIEYSAPFPEGDAWRLRGFRPRSYATRQTVRELVSVLTEWHEVYPEAQRVKLGEFSKRGGGRVRPHKSHRTGRDVDIGYVMLEADEGHRFTRATADNLDAAATWGLVHRLLASGSVEAIFMDARVQALLVPHASATLSDEEQQAIFSSLAVEARAKKKAPIRAWGGHDDHMHVRFSCTDADTQCRAAVSRKKRKRKRRRKGKKSRSRKKSGR